MSGTMEASRWEVHRKLITYLYLHNSLSYTMEVMADGPQFKATKREYVYRLGIWVVKKVDPRSLSAGRLSQNVPLAVEELCLCLSERATTWREYWTMTSLLRDGKQDIGLLFRCARAVETLDEAMQLHGHIERRLQVSSDEEETGNSTFLRILQSYALYQAGDKEKARAAVDGSVALLARDDFPSRDRRTSLFAPYKIDVPALSLVSYAMKLYGVDSVTVGRKVQDVLLTQLPGPGREVFAERVPGRLLDRSLRALEATSISDTLSAILETPCGDIVGGCEYRARVCVFSFLVSQFLDGCSATDNPFHDMYPAFHLTQSLCISVYDILFTLTFMMLRRSSASFEHLDASPSDVISLAREGGQLLPQGSHLLVVFLDAYASWTLPRQHSAEEREFMKAVFVRACKVIRPAMNTPDADSGNPLGAGRDEILNASLETAVDNLTMSLDSWFENSMAGRPQHAINVSLPSSRTGLPDRDSHLPAGSVESVQERIFDLPDHASTIDIMTATTSQPTTKGTMSTSQNPGRKLAQQDMAMGVDSRKTPADHPDTLSDVEEDASGYESDTDTIYSSVSQESDNEHSYIQSFLNRFSNDCPGVVSESGDCGFDTEYLEKALKEFASRLHAESTNQFQREAAVTLHKIRRETVERVLQQTGESSDFGLLSVGVESDDGEMRPEPFFKSPDITLDWLSGVEELSEMDLYAADVPREIDDAPQLAVEEDAARQLTVKEDAALPQLSAYESFICTSEAYAWLLSKMQQSKQLNWGSSHSASEIGTRILRQLRRRESLRRMSRRRPTAIVTMTFELEWDPAGVLPRETSEHCHSLDDVLCLTGTLNEAQATTVMEYMIQTWPDSCCPTMTLLSQLVSVPQGKECHYPTPGLHPSGGSASVTHRKKPMLHMRAQFREQSKCTISVTGGAYAVAEVGDQLGWLASALRVPPPAFQSGIVSCRPWLEELQLHGNDGSPSTTPSMAFCCLSFSFERLTDGSNAGIRGTCWSAPFQYAVLVQGYPVLSRPCRNTGLEVSLGTMAFLTQSPRVVRFDGRIIMKGFSSLAIATLATAGVVVWHLIVSEGRKKRISYIDPRLDDLEYQTPESIHPRSIESSRHIIGWCVDAVDLCGHSSAKLNVKPSGLGGLPASTTIDRLYIEAGATVVVGFNMCLNKKQQPVRLSRARDYPSLLNWVRKKVINFYDVSSRRAWLVDGASALLHLLRIWLELNQGDPESAYTWVFDPSMLKDTWEGCTTARQAALKTLKSLENLDLGLYVIEGDEHAKLRSRLKDILLDLELMIDWQERGSSPDGINISQSFDVRKKITGFDVFDAIAPERAVQPRVQTLDQALSSWSEGWTDLVFELGVLTIFGSDFGCVIRPSEDCVICPHWKILPTGQDYMAASVSTLQHLHQQYLARPASKLGAGALTRKMGWYSEGEPLNLPVCAFPANRVCESKPVQLLSSRGSWTQGLAFPSLKPVNVMGLDECGAVIFGHRSLLGLARSKRDTCTGPALGSSGEQSTEGSVSTSNAGAGSSLGRSGGQSAEESPPTSNASSHRSVLSLLGRELWEKRQKPTVRWRRPAGRGS